MKDKGVRRARPTNGTASVTPRQAAAPVPDASPEPTPPPDPNDMPLYAPLIRIAALEKLTRFFLISSVIATFGLLFSVASVARSTSEPQVLASGETVTPRPTRYAIAIPPSPTPSLPVIALLAGHSGGADTGALCNDGLREVDVTTGVAQKAKVILEARKYQVDILAEFDPRLDSVKRSYAPRVFLSIHADSCIKSASGYKVARATYSAIPVEDDRLVRCVSSEYAAATQLSFHADTITTDMTQYHAFNEIASDTPAAIIELGFLGSEHELLKNRRDLLGEAVANGIDDYMHDNQCRKTNP